MLFEVMRPATGLEVGETYSPEDLAKKGDVANMQRKGIVRVVGFLAEGQPLTDSEAARQIEELQGKLTAAEDERDAARDECRELNLKIRSLHSGHAEGAKQLRQAMSDLAAARAELAAIKASRVKVE